MLSTIEDAEGKNATQERIFGGLHQFIATMDSDKVRTSSRYKWSSTRCLGNLVVPTALTCTSSLKLPPTYATYTEFVSEFASLGESERVVECL